MTKKLTTLLTLVAITAMAQTPINKPRFNVDASTAEPPNIMILGDGALKQGTSMDFTVFKSHLDSATGLTANDLNGGTTLTVGSHHFDTLTVNRVLSALPGGSDGDVIKLTFNVTGAERTLDFHTNSTVYRIGDSGALATTASYPVGNHTLALVKLDAKWWLTDSGDIAEGPDTDAWVIAISDETTDLTTGTAKVTFRAPYAAAIIAVRASLTTANTGSTSTYDINEGGTTVLSTKLTIDAGEKTSTTAAVAPVISDTSIADDAEITIDIDQIGSTIAGSGAKITIIHTH